MVLSGTGPVQVRCDLSVLGHVYIFKRFYLCLLAIDCCFLYSVRSYARSVQVLLGPLFQHMVDQLMM